MSRDHPGHQDQPNSRDPDRPRPWSAEDLRNRLARLPPNHPSSPEYWKARQAREASQRAEAGSPDEPGKPDHPVSEKWYARHQDRLADKDSARQPREPGPWAPFDRDTADQLPRRDKPSEPVRGILDCGEAGKFELRSGHELVPPELGVPRDTARLVVMQDHVEGHAAVRLRTLGVDRATLYVSKDPCKGRLGCDRMLPFMLPEGARLTVYSPDGQPRLYAGWSDRKELPR